MALEEFKARIALLLDEMYERPEDRHELQERVREQLEGLKGMGMPLPQDLVDLERSLEEDLELPRRARRTSPRPDADTSPETPPEDHVVRREQPAPHRKTPPDD